MIWVIAILLAAVIGLGVWCGVLWDEVRKATTRHEFSAARADYYYRELAAVGASNRIRGEALGRIRDMETPKCASIGQRMAEEALLALENSDG